MPDWLTKRPRTSTLEQATKISAKSDPGGGTLSPVGEPYFPSVAVIFPKDQVFTVDRAGMWVDGDCIRIGMWPAELKPQYDRVYSDSRKVEALLELGNDANWTVRSNFHLAYRFANPTPAVVPRQAFASAVVPQPVDPRFPRGRWRSNPRRGS
jgi:O-acetyl-ADP-ribose deacetylase